ncbi:hypothetical protein [Saccharothrix sp. HUAS TT1]|uniref:hypothetical protein n=1 Tax=unclassified Saccharothrix TaxID=2593673 RepID=UPI00345BCD56
MTAETITIRVPVYPATPMDFGSHPEHGGRVDRLCRLCGTKTRSFDTGDWPRPEDDEVPDQVVLSDLFGTVHATCYVRVVERQQGAGAWTILAADIAKAPSKYRAADIRAVLGQLLRIVSTKALRKAVSP